MRLYTTIVVSEFECMHLLAITALLIYYINSGITIGISTAEKMRISTHEKLQ